MGSLHACSILCFSFSPLSGPPPLLAQPLLFHMCNLKLICTIGYRTRVTDTEPALFLLKHSMDFTLNLHKTNLHYKYPPPNVFPPTSNVRKISCIFFDTPCLFDKHNRRIPTFILHRQLFWNFHTCRKIARIMQQSPTYRSAVSILPHLFYFSLCRCSYTHIYTLLLLFAEYLKINCCLFSQIL